MKKILSVLLAALMLLSMLPAGIAETADDPELAPAEWVEAEAPAEALPAEPADDPVADDPAEPAEDPVADEPVADNPATPAEPEEDDPAAPAAVPAAEPEEDDPADKPLLPLDPGEGIPPFGPEEDAEFSWEDEPITFVPASDGLPSARVRAERYIDSVLYPDRQTAGTLGTVAGSNLTGNEKALYTAIVALCKQVADGELTSTKFTITYDKLGWEWTAADLGVSTIVENRQITAEAQAAIDARTAFDAQKLMHALMMDLGYELYWYDTTEGFTYGRSYYGGASKIQVNQRLSFFVAGDYAADDTYFTVSTRWSASVRQARNNAASIVSENASKNDYEKLRAYASEICKRTDYNWDAVAEDSEMLYGNPWQMIWTLDDDTTNMVVCEGYAKAFQYLCDLTTFRGSVQCYTVSGEILGGGHRWNVVRMEDGENYLVDVTNCDEGNYCNYYLFLIGYSATNSLTSPTYYDMLQSNAALLRYSYKDWASDTFTAQQLRIADHDYNPIWGNYTVTFKGNGGTPSRSSKTVSYRHMYGDLPSATRTGYTFDGWYTAAYSGTRVYWDTKVTRTSNQTLYAHWHVNKYTASFDANGGSCATLSKTVTYDANYGTLPTPTRDHFTFAGWWTAKSGGEQITASTKMTTARNHTLYALWIPQPSNIVSTTVTFEGQLSMSCYVVLSDGVLDDPNAYAEINFYHQTSSDTKRIAVKDAPTSEKDGVTRRKFEINVFAINMRDTLNFKLYDGDGNELPLTYKGTAISGGFDYTVLSYLRGRQQNSSSETMRSLAYAAEYYGTAAQLYFGYRTDQLTTAEINSMKSAIAGDGIKEALSAYAGVENGDLPAGISKKSTTVVFEADNSLREYFYTDSLTGYAFTLDGHSVTPRLFSTGRYYIEIPNIAAVDLGNPHTFTASKNGVTFTHTTSGLGYCYGRVTNSSNADMVNLAKTTYLYSMAARAYFGK